MTDAIQELADLRSKVLSGVEVPPEEFRRVLDALREDRKSAAATTKKAKEAAQPKVQPKDLADLFK